MVGVADWVGRLCAALDVGFMIEISAVHPQTS